MKTFITITTLLIAFLVTPAAAHHAADGIVDEDIYAMIDSMVADTPHADLTFDSMTGDMVIDTTTVYLAANTYFVADLTLYTQMLSTADSLLVVFNDDGTVSIVIE